MGEKERAGEDKSLFLCKLLPLRGKGDGCLPLPSYSRIIANSSPLRNDSLAKKFSPLIFFACISSKNYGMGAVLSKFVDGFCYTEN